jgi:serine/threonine-protein kinase HipA
VSYDEDRSIWDGTWTLNHQMSVNGHFDQITLDDLRALADPNEVPGIEKVLREVSQAIDAWPEFAKAAGVDDETTANVTSDIDDLRPR